MRLPLSPQGTNAAILQRIASASAEIQAILCNQSRPGSQPRDQVTRKQGVWGLRLSQTPAVLRRFRRRKRHLAAYSICFEKSKYSTPPPPNLPGRQRITFLTSPTRVLFRDSSSAFSGILTMRRKYSVFALCDGNKRAIMFPIFHHRGRSHERKHRHPRREGEQPAQC